MSSVVWWDRGIAAVIGFFVVSIVAPAAAQSALDPLLAGLDEGCTRTPLFQAWQDDLIARHLPRNGVQPGHADVTPYAAAIGVETAVDKGDWKEVAVPLKATYRGVATKRLVFSFGKENGIYGYALEFDAPAETVRATFAGRVKRSAAKLKAEGDDGFAGSTGFDFKRRVALWCDFSN